MEKTNVILGMLCMVGIMASSCVKEKENENENHNEKVKTNSSTAKLVTHLKSTSFAGTYSLASQVGHNSSDCGGKCKFINGEWSHLDCQGNGNICSCKASVCISKVVPDNPEDIYYFGMGLNDYEPIEAESFSMPARSFYIENIEFENRYTWINIPGQELQRDKETKQFIYKEVTFTDKAMFENL